MAAPKQPGIADPYWYEWSVGLLKVIDMIGGFDGIESVTFQEAGFAGIDDIVVRYSSGRPPTCYQVKHKIAGLAGNASFTFGDLVGRAKDRPPLISSLVDAWTRASKEWEAAPDVVLYSNRDAGTRRGKRTFNGVEYKQHPLETFVEEAKRACISESDCQSVRFHDSDMQLQWEEFVEAAGCGNNDDLIRFMRHFSINLSKPSLNDTMELIVNHLRDKVLAGNASLAERACELLFASLREWTTAGIGRNVVDREKALRCLAKLNEKPLSQPIDVAVPKPMFESRARFAKELATHVQEGSESVYFVTGKPGIGKTRLMSMLCTQLSQAPFRFYAFKPLDAEDASFAPDSGQSSAFELWSALLNQLRSAALGRFEDSSIPIVNDLCTDDQLRSEALRLASSLAEDRGESTVLIIDGIDHAARAGSDTTFLNHLPSPDSVPAGVKLVLAGQPASLYPSYPAWLRRPTSNVSTIEIGPIDANDIAALLAHKTALDENAIALVSKTIVAKTAGNTLSVVYAVHAVARLEDKSNALEMIHDLPISDNVIEYYEHIWAKIRAAIEKENPSAGNASLVIACTMHLLDGLISPELLNGAFPEMFPQTYLAEQALLCAAPLLRRTRDGAYCPLHNDFRLFVSGMASDPSAEPCLTFATDRLATHLLASDASSIRSCYAIRLLARSGRERECLELFDTGFVIDSLSQGIPWDYLCEQAETAYGCACSIGSITAVSKTLLAAATLAQANEHFEYLQEGRPFSHADRITYQDMLIAPLNAQHIYAYKQALDRAVWLAGDCNLPEEAALLFDAWMAGLSPSQFAQAIWGADYESFNYNEGQEFKQLCKTWGVYAALADVECPELDRDYWINDEADEALLSFRDSYVRQRVISDCDTETIIQSIRGSGMSYEGVRDLLRDGMAGGHGVIGAGFQAFLSALESSRNDNPYRVIAKALLVLSGQASPFPLQEESSLLCERKISFVTSGEDLLQLAAECFMFGMSDRFARGDDAIRSARKRLSWMDASQREYVEFIHYADALTCLGHALGHNQPILAKTVEAEAIGRCLRGRHHIGFDPLTSVFVQHALFSSASRNLWERAFAEDDLEALALSGTFTLCKLPLLDYLVETNRTGLLTAALSAVYGNDGSRILSSTDPKETHEMLRAYVGLIDKEFLEKCDAAISYSFASFTDHKDYSLSHAVDLYRIACEAGNVTEPDTQLLLAIDSAANETGDNRVSESITTAVVGWAAGEGPAQLSRIRSWLPTLRYDYDDLASQASALLASAMSPEDIHACFALLYGSTSYYRESGLQQIRSFAEECCERIDSLGFDPKEKSEILTAIEPFSKLSLESSHNSETPSTQLMSKTSSTQSASALSLAELEDIAFQKPQDKWEWDEIEAAYSEMLSQGCPAEETTAKLIASRLREFSQGGWARFSQSLMEITQKVAENASDEAFFKLIEVRKEKLHLYGFGSSVDDVQYAIAHRVRARNPEQAITLLRDELQSKRLWVTANGHLPFEFLHGDGLGITDPGSIPELVADALFESMVEQDPHRCEDAVRGIIWGGFQSERMMNRFSDIAKRGCAYQRQLAWKVIDCWMRSRTVDSIHLSEVVTEAHTKAQRLDEALLTALVADMPQLVPRPTHLPKGSPATGRPASLPHRAEAFFRVMGMITEGDYDDLRTEILTSCVEPVDNCNVTRHFSRREDVENPGHDSDELFQQLLLREHLAGRWYGASLGTLASLLFDPADAWVMRRLPTMSDGFRTGVRELIEALEDMNESGVRDRSRKIARIGLPLEEEAIAWVLYIPYGETDELRIIHAPKLFAIGERLDSVTIDAIFGCYGVMAGKADMFGVLKGSAGIPLFGEQIGTISIMGCDCEILPCRALEMIGYSPNSNDPITWNNATGTAALRFERLVCPAGSGFYRNMYYRQMQLWRWVGNMDMLKSAALRTGLTLHETEIVRRNTDAIRERMNEQHAIDIAPPTE